MREEDDIAAFIKQARTTNEELKSKQSFGAKSLSVKYTEPVTKVVRISTGGSGGVFDMVFTASNMPNPIATPVIDIYKNGSIARDVIAEPVSIFSGVDSYKKIWRITISEIRYTSSSYDVTCVLRAKSLAKGEISA